MIKVFQAASLGAALIFTMGLTGCVDKDYDLSNIDMTIGTGNNLRLPNDNSTGDICLDDVLDLGNNNFLKIKEDGKYSIHVMDDDEFVAHMWVDAFTVPAKTYTGTYTLNLGDFNPVGKRRVKKADDDIIDFEAPMVDMDFTYAYKSDQISSLSYVGIEGGRFAVRLDFSQDLQNALKNVAEMKFYMPQCVVLGKAAFHGDSISLDENNVLTLRDVKLNEDLYVEMKLLGFDLSGEKADGSYLSFTKGTGLRFHGALKMGVTVRESDIDFDKVVEAKDLTVSGKAGTNKLKVISAKGAFAPTRQFGSVGGVSLKNVPSFLTDNDVNLDLYDPQLNIDIYSQVPFATKMTGAIVSKDSKGNVIQRIDIPQFSYKANGKSVISVRRREAATKGDTTVIVVPNITDVIRNLPDSIALIDLVGTGDDSQETEIGLDHNYRGTMRLSVASGISFGEDAQIVYKDDFTGWNDEMKKISFVEAEDNTVKGYLKVNANIQNKIPAYLTLKAYGIDVKGNVIGQDLLEVTVEKVIDASKDGVNPAKTEEVIYIRPKNNEVFKILDGLTFRIYMAAKNGSDKVTGVMLNAYNQTIKVSDIAIRKYGKMAIDMN